MLADEALQYLAPGPGGNYLDGTLGGAGHARLILEASAPDGVLVGLDRDADALEAASRVLAPYAGRVLLRQANFAELSAVLDAFGIGELDGLLLDLGVSSHQLDSAARGFSFREEGPLDMRMDRAQGVSAAEVVAEEERDELRRIFREYGEERYAGRIASEIVKVRAQQPLTTTTQLAELVSRVVPGGRDARRIHPATRVFQALRIHVNRELESLETALSDGLERLKEGGRMVVISFHSLEDRMVKRAFRDAASGCTCPPRLAVCACGRTPRARILTRKGVKASAGEVELNPRSRSAVLRAVEKLAVERQ